MTSVASYRSNFETAMRTLGERLPAGSRISVGSIPNVYQLWSLLHTNGSAVSTWSSLGICQSMSELLQTHGSEVAFAVCAADALALIAARRFDLVVSDVVMPDMDGYDLYMELKETRPELPVILMTGYLYDRDHVIKRSKLAGLATGVLYKKPIDLERLKTIIHTHRFPKEAHVEGPHEPVRAPTNT